MMAFTIETEQEEDGRWIAEIRELPGCLAYGQDRDDAITRATVLALRILADRLENHEPIEHSKAPFGLTFAEAA